MSSRCPSTRRPITVLVRTSVTIASVAVATTASSFERNEMRIGSLVELHGPGSVCPDPGTHVSDRAGMARDVVDHRLIVGQLGRRQALAREDALLPIASHRGH